MTMPTLTDADPAIPALPASTACLWVTDNPRHCSLLRPAPNVVNAFPWPAGNKTPEDAAFWRERGFWQEPLFTADQMNTRWLDGYAAGRASRVQGEAVAWLCCGSLYHAYAAIPSGQLPPVGIPVPLYTAPQAETLAVAEFPDDGELESWRATADDLLRARSDNAGLTRRAAFLLQNAYLFVRALAAAPTPTASIAPKGEPTGWRSVLANARLGLGAGGRNLGDQAFIGYGAALLDHIEEGIKALSAPKAEGEAVAELIASAKEVVRTWREDVPMSDTATAIGRLDKALSAPVAQAAVGIDRLHEAALAVGNDWSRLINSLPQDDRLEAFEWGAIRELRAACAALTTPRPEATAVAHLEWTARRSSDGLRVVIDSADFEHDATLVLTGDFESEAQKLWFAGAIADKLNRTAVAPVAGEVKL